MTDLASPAGAAAIAPSVDRRAKRLTLIACILGSSVVFLDGTLVNVALPAIRADLHGGLATQEWVVDAYLLTLGSLLLVGGSLGDLFGRRRIFATGVVAFGAASLLCAAAPGSGALIAARAAQGVAGALLVPSTLALIMDTFDDHERAAAIGSWTAWTGIATVIGPLVGGSLVQAASWRWIFVINVPLVLATLWLLRAAPRGVVVADARVDWVGGTLCALGLGGPIFALIEQPRYGWSAVEVWPPLLAGLALLVAFLVWERRSRSPMLQLDLFRTRNFSVGNISTLLLYGGLSCAIFFLVVYLQQVAGYSPLAAGAALLPLSIVMFLLAKRFGTLADRFGPRLFMGIGPLLAAAGLLLMLSIGSKAPYLTEVLPGAMLFALGMAMTVAPLTAAVLGAVAAGHSGIAAAVNNALARVAGLIAIAAVGAAVSAQFSSGLESRLAGARSSPALHAAVEAARTKTFVIDVRSFPVADRPRARGALEGSSLDGIRLALAISAALVALAGAISLAGIRNRGRVVPAEGCAGGALCGASVDVAQDSRLVVA